MSMGRELLGCVVLTALLLVAAPMAYAADVNPRHRPAPSVVVKVDDGGFHWEDAGVGAVGTLAGGLLVLGLVLTIRSGGRRTQ